MARPGKLHAAARVAMLVTFVASMVVATRLTGDLGALLLSGVVAFFAARFVAQRVNNHLAGRAWVRLVAASATSDALQLASAARECRSLYGVPREEEAAVFLDLAEARAMIAYDEIAAARALLRVSEDDVPAKYRSAHAAISAYAALVAGDYSAAIACAERAGDTGDAHAAFAGDVVAIARLRLGDVDAALERFRARRDADDVTGEAWLHFGDALRSVGRNDEAVFAYHRAEHCGEPWATRARNSLQALEAPYRA